MKLFFTISNPHWSGKPIPPELGSFCVSPVHSNKGDLKENKIAPIPGAAFILDCGAFQAGPRLSFRDAWERQLSHAWRNDYLHQVTYIVANDEIIGMFDYPGKPDPVTAVETTIAAAQYARWRRDTHLPEKGLILPVQGATPAQYAACAEKIIPYVHPEKDILGLGGWARIGQYRSLLPSFATVLRSAIPTAAQAGIRRVHLFGVMLPEALGMLEWWCDQYGIQAQVDSSSPVMKTTRGERGYGDDWEKLESIAHLSLEERREWRYEHRVAHCLYAKEFAAHIRETRYYTGRSQMMLGLTA